jgi:hypothetical protein
MNLTLITDAGIADEPLQVTDAGDYLRDVPAEDVATVQRLITAARLEAENENGRELARKQWTLVLDHFPRGKWVSSCRFDGYGQAGSRVFALGAGAHYIELLDPLVTVDSFTYKKSDGTVVPMVLNTDYIVDVMKHPGIVCPASGTTWPGDDLWPSSAVQLTFTAGMTPDQCPEGIRQGMRLLVSEWFENRLPFANVRFIAEMPFSVTNLFRNKKLWRF